MSIYTRRRRRTHIQQHDFVHVRVRLCTHALTERYPMRIRCGRIRGRLICSPSLSGRVGSVRCSSGAVTNERTPVRRLQRITSIASIDRNDFSVDRNEKPTTDITRADHCRGVHASPSPSESRVPRVAGDR